MADNKDYISYVSDGGSIHISEEVVAAVAAGAAADVEGVAGLRSGSTGDGSARRSSGRGVKVKLETWISTSSPSRTSPWENWGKRSSMRSNRPWKRLPALRSTASTLRSAASEPDGARRV